MRRAGLVGGRRGRIEGANEGKKDMFEKRFGDGTARLRSTVFGLFVHVDSFFVFVTFCEVELTCEGSSVLSV